MKPEQSDEGRQRHGEESARGNAEGLERGPAAIRAGDHSGEITEAVGYDDLDSADTATPFRHPNRPERKKAGGNFKGPEKG